MKKDKRGRNALFASAVSGHLNILKLLHEKGLYYESDNNGSTPLHQATKHNQIQIVEYLIDNMGAEVKAKDSRGIAPIHYASMIGSQ